MATENAILEPCHVGQATRAEHELGDGVPCVQRLNGIHLMFGPAAPGSADSIGVVASPRHFGSATTPVQLLMTFTSCVVVAFAMRKLLATIRRRRWPTDIFSPSTKLPRCRVPACPIFGHMPNVFSPPDSPRWTSIFIDQANSEGLSTFLFLGVPCVGVLKAEHAKIVLRNSIERVGSMVIARHFKRSLGEGEFVGPY